MAYCGKQVKMYPQGFLRNERENTLLAIIEETRKNVTTKLCCGGHYLEYCRHLKKQRNTVRRACEENGMKRNKEYLIL